MTSVVHRPTTGSVIALKLLSIVTSVSGCAGELVGSRLVGWLGGQSVDLSSDVAVEASDDDSRGEAFSGAACEVVDGGSVPPLADEHDAAKRCVCLPVPASVQTMPAGGLARSGRDWTYAAHLRERGFGPDPVGVVACGDQHLGGGIAVQRPLVKRLRAGRTANPALFELLDDEVIEARVQVDDPGAPRAAQLGLLSDSPVGPRTRGWFDAWWDGHVRGAAAAGIDLLPTDHRQLDDMSAAEYRSLHELPLDRVSLG